MKILLFSFAFMTLASFGNCVQILPNPKSQNFDEKIDYYNQMNMMNKQQELLERQTRAQEDLIRYLKYGW